MDVASLVSTWSALVQQLALVFTDATARTWEQIAKDDPGNVRAFFETFDDR